MAVKMFRDCGSEIFNTGTSKCPFTPDFIKAIILTPVGMTFKISDFDTKLGEYAHADRPNRIYPISTIAEYATSGGEAQTSATGYGSSKITGYSELVETYTMNDYDEGLRTNLMKLKNESMRVIFIDKNNVVYGEKTDTEGDFRGYELGAVYPGGQRFKSSGENASLTINLVYKDVEKAWMNAISFTSDIDILEEAKGLVWVDVKKLATGENKYKVVEHYGGFDLTEMYGTLLGASSVWNNVTAATYNPDDGTLSLTPSSGTPALKRPSELYTEGVKGIEQWS